MSSDSRPDTDGTDLKNPNPRDPRIPCLDFKPIFNRELECEAGKR